MKAHLSISLEDDGQIILLFVPDETKSEHYHITLSDRAAEQLAAALDRFTAGDNEHDVYDIPVEGVV